LAAEPEAQQPEYVYRRIHPHGWNTRKNKAKESAFIARPDAGLSVFRADLRSPRQVIQHGIEAAKTMLASTDEGVRQRGEKQLTDFGDTVEQWVDNGWRVVRIPASAFTS
jgi:hypothetical protein